MSWLAPWALAAAAAAALGIGLLHLLARDRPPRWILPTARFVAPGWARATRRARTPRDPMLLALRALALLLAGAAFAGPVLRPRGGSIARVVLVDLRTGPDARAATMDSVRARLREGDRLVLFDTIAHVVDAGRERTVLDSLGASRGDSAGRGSTGGSLSAGLVAAMRIASIAAVDADSVGLTIVSPLIGVEDRATVAIRAQWPGRVDAVAIEPRVVMQDSGWPLHVRGAAGDPVVVAARLAGATIATPADGASPRGTRIVRGTPSPGDSAFARAGGTLVAWRDSARAAPRDTVSGFIAGGAPVLFATWRREPPVPGRVVAWWLDGAPAATEAALGSGCIRDVAIEIPPTGDLTLRPAFQRALQALAQPCGAGGAPASDTLLAALARPGPLATASEIRRDITGSPATPWLLGAALLLLLLEPLLRRSARQAQPAGESA